MAVVSYEYNGTLAIEVCLFFIFAVVFSFQCISVSAKDRQILRQFPCH
jgi:hypothetical protein